MSEESKSVVAVDGAGASRFASEIVVAGEEAGALAKHVADGDIAGIWEHCEDFEKLSEATIKTVQHLNEEHIRRMSEQLNAHNEQMLNATFEGVKRHHKKQVAKLERRYKQRAAIAAAVAFIAGVGLGWVVFALPNL